MSDRIVYCLLDDVDANFTTSVFRHQLLLRSGIEVQMHGCEGFGWKNALNWRVIFGDCRKNGNVGWKAYTCISDVVAGWKNGTFRLFCSCLTDFPRAKGQNIEFNEFGHIHNLLVWSSTSNNWNPLISHNSLFACSCLMQNWIENIVFDAIMFCDVLCAHL